VDLPGFTQPAINQLSIVTSSINNADTNESPEAGITGDHTRPIRHSPPISPGTGADAITWWESGRNASYDSITSGTLLASSRSVGGNAFSQRSLSPTESPTLGPALPPAASDDPDGGQDNVPSGSLVTSEESSHSEIVYIMAPKTCT
jgi:hypothetical protein